MRDGQLLDISIRQGSTFEWTIAVKDATDPTLPQDLTGMTVAGKLRKSYSNATATSFTVTTPNPINGQAKLTLTATATAALSPGKYVYDVEVTDTQGVSTCLYYGRVLVVPEATKP